MRLLALLYYRESLHFIQPFSLTFAALPLSVPVSRMWARSVIRSNRALHRRVLGNTCVHSENGKFVDVVVDVQIAGGEYLFGLVIGRAESFVQQAGLLYVEYVGQSGLILLFVRKVVHRRQNFSRRRRLFVILAVQSFSCHS